MTNIARIKTKLRGIVGLTLFLCSLILSLPWFTLAQTAEESAFLGRLESVVQDSGQNGECNLGPAQGSIAFEGRFSGLKDSSAEVRAGAAEIICRYASARQSLVLANTLYNKAKQEADPLAKEKIYLAYLKLKMKYATDKNGLVLNFLNAYLVRQEGISRGAIKYMIAQARDNFIFACRPALVQLKDFFAQDAGLKDLLNDSLRILDLSQRYKDQAFYEVVLAQAKISLQEWAIWHLTQEDSKQSQRYANNILLRLLSEKNGRCFLLERGMQERGILRSENINPSFEFGGEFPEGWQIAAKTDALSRVIYSSSGAASYDRCIEVDNHSGETSLSNALLYFVGKKPLGIELGFAYKIVTPQKGFMMIGVANQDVSTKPSVRLSAAINFQDGSQERKDLLLDLPISDTWDEFTGVYRADKSIDSVQLEVIVTGKIDVCLDDIYLRRSTEHFSNRGPKINRLSIFKPRATSYPQDYYTLKASVTDPDLDRVDGRWSSNLEGDLGQGLEIMVKFSKAGDHLILFEAWDEFGAVDLKSTSLKN
jgi:hypothetical protein